MSDKTFEDRIRQPKIRMTTFANSVDTAMPTNIFRSKNLRDSRVEMEEVKCRRREVHAAFERETKIYFFPVQVTAPRGGGKLPARAFSADGSTFYMSVVQLGEVRLMAVDLETGQVTFSPRGGGVRLVDVKDDVMLVTIAMHGDHHGDHPGDHNGEHHDHDHHRDAGLYASRPTLAIGRLHEDYW